MSKKNVALVVCDSGLGHLVRCVKIANELVKKKYVITIYCKIIKLELIQVKISNKIFFKNFVTNHDKNLNFRNFKYNWAERLPNLGKYDLIVSDNLPEILEKYPKTILIANFFWHRIIPNFKYFEHVEALLHTHKPLIICNKYVSHKYLSNYNDVKKIGFFSDLAKYKKKNKNFLLLSEGTAHTNSKNKFKLIKYLKEVAMFFDKIYLEPKYFYDENFYKKIYKFNKKIILATYKKRMFSQISHAIIKPGLGLITECISHNVKCLYFYEGFNKEFELNTKKLESYKIGKRLNMLNIKRLKEELLDINSLKKSISTPKIEWSAQKTMIKIISKKIKSNEKKN